MNTTESNKLIAEFMGYETREGYPNEIYDSDGIYHGTYSMLDYHESWHTLVPVVEKIEKNHAYVNIKGCAVDISTVVSLSAPTKIEAVYKAVVYFIKWYNENSRDE